MKFGGERFAYDSKHKTKAGADKRATTLRKAGYRVRIKALWVKGSKRPSGSPGGYEVWYSPKPRKK